jgi:hypothetical protein
MKQIALTFAFVVAVSVGVAARAQDAPAPDSGDKAVAAESTADAQVAAPEKAAPVYGKDPKPRIDEFFKKHFKLDFQLVNIFQYANDSDFDHSVPEPDTYGQSTGMFGTYLKPQLNVYISDFFRFYWEMELGLDLWSRNSTDATLGVDDGGSPAFGIRQRELYADIIYKKLCIRLGYQRLIDVSGLFINHWIGAGSIRYGEERQSNIRLFGGQMPDQTFEGWELTKNSLVNDVYVAGLDGQWVFNSWVKLVAGVYYLGDLSLNNYRKDVGVLSVGAAFEGKGWDAKVAVVGQFGRRANASADGSDSAIKAWGVVADGGIERKHFEFRLSGTVLSADDNSSLNDSTAFIWSGKRPGLSIMLSENELRDTGNNIDERMASREGLFHNTMAGIAGIDLALFYKPVDYIKIGFVTSQLLSINPDNIGGGRFVASENDLVFEVNLLHNLLRLQATGGIVVPGSAGAAQINRIDGMSLNNIYFCQLGVVLNF